ncbi:MAG TPA: family 20 glycosylhydrolase, partial [Arachidicoccus sp.]|nr:family 20 glycosylhydrolase [Arachidicoccus sp.]
PISKVYAYDPLGNLNSTSKKYVIGAEGCLWTEYMKSPAKVEYMLFPRLAALSEVFWTTPKNKNYNNFVHRLTTQVDRYKLWKINYCIKYTTE